MEKRTMTTDRWKDLCEAIMREPDPQKLMELVEKLNLTLEERENELKAKRGEPRSFTSLA
jgi:hypothetical protein